MNKWMVFTGIGFELVGLILAAIWLGPMIEELLPLKGLWVAVLILLALGLWLFHLMLLLKRVSSD